MPGRRAAGRSAALALLVLGAAPAVPAGAEALRDGPPIIASPCPVGGLVDAAFRDAAVATLKRLAVVAPGRPAHGALRSQLGPGHVDGRGRHWQQVSAYPANLGLAGALRVAPSLLPLAADWLRWQARHIAPTGALRGVVVDHWVRSEDQHESICPDDLPKAQCGSVDAHDSTAATTLLLAEAYQRYGGDTAVLREPMVRAGLEAAAQTLSALAVRGESGGGPPGMAIATPEHPVVYTMDVAEVIAGWRAWAAVQQAVYAQPQSAAVSRATAERMAVSLRDRLWLPAAKAWRVSLDGGAPQPEHWYPDTMAQAWPLLWGSLAGLPATDPDRAAGAWRRAVAPWRGTRDWSRRNVDPDGFWWPAAAVAARCTGDDAAARAWVARARQAWMQPNRPFAWPFQVSDLLWLSWLADPPPASAPP